MFRNIGKILGFALGFLYLPFLGGALFGLFLGSILDKKLFEQKRVDSSIFGHGVSRQMLIMQTTFAIMGHMSKAKGQVTKEDILLAKQLMQRFNLDNEMQVVAQNAFNMGKSQDFPVERVLNELRQAISGRGDLIRMFIEIQVQVALDDGELHAKEKELLFKIAQNLGVGNLQLEQIIAMVFATKQFTSGGYYQQYQEQFDTEGEHDFNRQRQYNNYTSGPSLKDACAVLGVNENDDQQTVKRAYRKLMNQHHPDKLMSKGLPEEMINMAKEKAQQIQAAYDLICDKKGW